MSPVHPRKREGGWSLNATGRTGLACKAGDLHITGNFKFASESVNEVRGSVQVTPGSAALPTEARGPSEAPVASEETQMTSEVLRHAQNPAAYRLDSVELNGTSVSRPVPCDDDTVRPL